MRVAILVGIAGLCCAQTAFEVASLKPAAPNNMGEGYSVSISPGGRLRGANVSLRQMIQIAWDLKQKNLVTGDVSWLDSQKYDLDAKAAGALGEPEARVMLQSLLLERFNLKYHRATRQLPVYFLEQAKSGVTGPDLQASPSGDCGNAECAGRATSHARRTRRESLWRYRHLFGQVQRPSDEHGGTGDGLVFHPGPTGFR
jgi:uncharacterized protein (TIGR03435 family)